MSEARTEADQMMQRYRNQLIRQLQEAKILRDIYQRRVDELTETLKRVENRHDR